MQTHKVSISFSARPGPQFSCLNFSAWCLLSCLSALPPPLQWLSGGRGEGRRTPRHCSQGSCLLQGLLGQQLHLCKSTPLLGWGVLTALELEQRRGDQSCSSSEPSGDPLTLQGPEGRPAAFGHPSAPGLSLQLPVCAHTLVFPQASVTWAWAARAEPTPSPFTHTFQIFVPTVGHARPSPVARR